MIKSAFVSTLLFIAIKAFPQITVDGTIYDQLNNHPLVGAHIFSPVDSAVTDHLGKFKIEIKSRPSVLHYTSLGYARGSANVTTDAPIIIRMVPAQVELDQVIVSSGLKEDKVINTSASVALITADHLKRDQPFSIVNSMNRIPGVFMHSGTLNTNRITLRGMGSRSLFATDKVKAYYDQVPLTDGSGNSAIEDLDQSLMERIEIVKGPNSSTYGSGLGGVIILRSKQPEMDETAMKESLTIGSFGTKRWLNQFTHNTSSLSLNLIHTLTESDGYRDNNNYKKQQTGLTGRHYFKNDSYLNFIGVYTDLFSQIPSSLNEADFKNNPKAAAANWKEAQGYEDYERSFIGLSYHYKPTKHLSVSHAFNFQNKNNYEPAPGPFVNIMDDRTGGFGSRNLIHYSKEKFTLSGGFEFFLDQNEIQMFRNLHSPTSNGSIKGAEYSHLEEKRGYVNSFCEISYRPTEKIKLVGGLNFNKTNYRLLDRFNTGTEDISGSYGFDGIWSPRIGSVFHLTPNVHWFTTISHGFSPPNLEQTLYPDGQINTDIQPETGWNFESGIRGTVGGFSYDVAAYFMDIKNLLVNQRTEEDVYIGVNAGRNHHFGSDVNLGYIWKLENGSALNLFSNLSVMHFRFKEFVNEEIDYSGNKLTGVPGVTVNAGVEWISATGFYGNINSQYSGKMPITDQNDIESKDYLIVRSKVGYAIQIKKFQLDLNVGIDNLTNKKYASMLLINSGTGRYYYPGLPRNYYGGVSLKYRFR